MDDATTAYKKRIQRACLKNREEQEARYRADKTRRLIIDSYVDGTIHWTQAIADLQQHCGFGRQGAIEALRYAQRRTF